MTDIKCYVSECKFYKNFKCTRTDISIDRDCECLTYELSDEARKEFANFGKESKERYDRERNGIVISRNLCDSCKTKGCIFQSGIVRSHCDFYKAESENKE